MVIKTSEIYQNSLSQSNKIMMESNNKAYQIETKIKNEQIKVFFDTLKITKVDDKENI